MSLELLAGNHMRGLLERGLVQKHSARWLYDKARDIALGRLRGTTSVAAGRLRGDGQPLSIRFKGREAVLGELEAALFGTAAPLRERAPNQDEPIDVEAEEAWPWETSTGERYVVQPWLDHACDPGACDDYLAQNLNPDMRRKARRALAAGYQRSTTSCRKQAAWFYRELFEPMANARFGEGASYGSLDVFLGMNGRTMRTEVSFLELAGERVAGIAFLVSPPRRLLRIWAYGMRHEILVDSRRRAEVMAALNAEAVRVAAAAGYTLNLGYTRPFLNDGVFVYKSRWGALPVPSDCSRIALRLVSDKARASFGAEAPLLHLAPEGVRTIAPMH
jgi:hypothetical protein